MDKKYILHKGAIWGLEKTRPAEIFRAIGFKEGEKIALNEIGKIQKILQKKAQRFIDKKLPGKKVNLETIVYHTVHQGRKVVGRHKIYCDIDIFENNKNNRLARFKDGSGFPKELEKALKRYKQELRKEIRKRGVVQSKNDAFLKEREQELKNCLKKYYSRIKDILLKSDDKRKRADAAWLLNWGENKEVPEVLSRVIAKDPDFYVCNNAAVSLLSYIKENKTKLSPLLIYSFLQKPSACCRNKGAHLFLELLKQRPKIKPPSRILDILRKMAHSSQPNNRQPAREILQKLDKTPDKL